jgi:hypothetical protein
MDDTPCGAEVTYNNLLALTGNLNDTIVVLRQPVFGDPALQY